MEGIMESREESRDLEFRPESYWDPGDPLTALIQNVTGEKRREMITDIVTRRLVDRMREAGDPNADLAEAFLGEVSPGLMEDVLDEARRTRSVTSTRSSWAGSTCPGTGGTRWRSPGSCSTRSRWT
jgi:hypothetical protein